MSDDAVRRASEAVEAAYREHSRAVLATLIRLLGDFDLAEEALHDAFRAALEQWPDGIPRNPRAWLVSAGRFKTIDGLRRRARFAPLDLDAHDAAGEAPEAQEGESVEDDRLRLIFTCCHPALSPDAQVALTLREVCGLNTEAIAAAFLTPAPTLAQRIVRAKAKIRDARIPYEVPSAAELPERLDSVLRVVYLVFNESYSASSGAALTRPDLSAEAIRLGRLLMQLLPEPEAVGLLALMLLHDSRRAARTSPSGDLVLLDEQDRSLWNRAQIEEGTALVKRVLASRRFGAYSLQAAIAALHAQAKDEGATDWNQVVGLYDVLLRIDPSPIVELNRAVAVAMRDGAEAIEFYKRAFGAEEIARMPGPDGKLMHAQIRIGDSAIMLVDEFPGWGSLGPKSLKGSPVTIHLYVEDVDGFVARAVAAGAKLTMPVQDMFWGDRYGHIEDPFGHRWSVATHIRDVSMEEMQQAMREMPPECPGRDA